MSSKNVLLKCETCADSGNSAHAQIIIPSFTLQSYVLEYSMILLADSEDPDQTARMRRLIWAFAVRMSEDMFPHGAENDLP